MKLLLDEHVSPAVAEGLRATGVEAEALRDWQTGLYREASDEVILLAAHDESRTLVTYDLRTIPPLLKTWGEAGTSHGGVIFIDERTIAPNDIGGLIRALSRLVAQLGVGDWENRVVYLSR